MGAFDDEAKHNGTAAVAIVEAFYPGPRGGEAMAQGLFGLHNRWGRMPYTIYPKDFEKEAEMTEHDIRAPPGRTYRYYPKPMFSFGEGLSLTTWNLVGDAPSCLGQLATSAPDKACTVSLKLTNTGGLAGDSVVLAYFRKTGPQEKSWAGGFTNASKKKLMPQLRQLFDFQRFSDVASGTTEII